MAFKINLTGKYVMGDGDGNNYPRSINIFLGINAVAILLPFVYATGVLDLFSMNIHPVWRIIGIIDFVLVIWIMIWQMKTLDVNISSIHQDRQIVISGPYKYVRHPLYLIFIIMTIDSWLISANSILLIAIPITILAGIIRANYEEKMLLIEYGEDYEMYQKKTGQLFPKLKRM